MLYFHAILLLCLVNRGEVLELCVYNWYGTIYLHISAFGHYYVTLFYSAWIVSFCLIFYHEVETDYF